VDSVSARSILEVSNMAKAKMKDVGLPLEGMLNSMARLSYGFSKKAYNMQRKR